MDGSLEFRRRLAARLLVLALAGSAACSSNVDTGKSGQGGQGGQGGTIIDPGGSYTTESCFAWPQAPGTGGAGGKGGAGGMGGAGGSFGTGGAGGAGGGMALPCPPMAEAGMYMDPAMSCGGMVQSEGTRKADKCCYTVSCPGAAGRPFLVEGQARAAEAASGRKAWSGEATPRPVIEGLTTAERALLAEAWARDGLLEHASVASFGRFALELLAVGAPPDLVAMAHQAALDEVRHARLAFALASAYAGTPLGPGPFPFGGSVAVSADLADIAARVVREGCVGETLASLIAAEQRARAVDPAVAEVLADIAEDEARHAELAWRTVAWAVAQGGASVQRAVAEAFAEALGTGTALAVVAGGEGILAAHGRPGEDVLRAAVQRALEDVIRPAALALLAGCA